MVGIIILTVVLYALLAGPTENALLSILPVWAAHLLANLLYFGLLPLAALAWLAENMASVLIGEFILTNQRIWIRGSPYAWSQGETQLDDIASLTWRRDAVFIRQKSTRNLQVHMFSDGKLFVKAYEQFIGK